MESDNIERDAALCWKKSAWALSLDELSVLARCLPTMRMTACCVWEGLTCCSNQFVTALSLWSVALALTTDLNSPSFFDSPWRQACVNYWASEVLLTQWNRFWVNYDSSQTHIQCWPSFRALFTPVKRTVEESEKFKMGFFPGKFSGKQTIKQNISKRFLHSRVNFQPLAFACPTTLWANQDWAVFLFFVTDHIDCHLSAGTIDCYPALHSEIACS